MNPDRSLNNSAGRLVQIGQGETAYWAFIPHPLPPALPFNAGLVNTLSDADRALGELAGLGRTLPNPQLLIAPFIRREAVLSSRIEGTQTDLTDLYAYEAGQLPLFAGLKTGSARVRRQGSDQLRPGHGIWSGTAPDPACEPAAHPGVAWHPDGRSAGRPCHSRGISPEPKLDRTARLHPERGGVRPPAGG